MTQNCRLLAVLAMLCVAAAELSRPTDARAATSVATIAALRALPAPTAPVQQTVGYYAFPGDHGGGQFRWDPASCAPDNGGTIIAPASAPACGRWMRLLLGYPSVAWFGARANDGLPDTDAIQAAVNALGRSGTLRFPPGHFVIETDKGIRLKSFMRLELTGATLQGKNVDGARCRMLEIQGKEGVEVSGGTLIGSRLGSPSLGVGILVDDSSNVTIENVWIRDFFTDGILLTGNQGSGPVTVRGCNVQNNRRTGLAVVHASDVNVVSSTFNGTNGQAPQAGVNCEPNAGEWVNRVRFYGCSIGSNAGVGLYVHRGLGGGVYNARIEHCVIAKNESGIVVSGVNGAWIEANQVNSHGRQGQSGIMVVDDTRSATVTGNTLQYNFRGIVGSGATGIVIRRNTILGTGRGSTAGYGNGRDGILCLAGPTGTLGDACLVTNNTIRRAAGNGIMARDVARANVANNYIEDVGQRGIHFRATTNSRITSNTVSGAGFELPYDRYDAIELEQGSSHNMVLSNIIRRMIATRTAIRVAPDSVSNTVSQNVVEP